VGICDDRHSKDEKKAAEKAGDRAAARGEDYDDVDDEEDDYGGGGVQKPGEKKRRKRGPAKADKNEQASLENRIMQFMQIDKKILEDEQRAISYLDNETLLDQVEQVSLSFLIPCIC
jgi:hypothetical protein